MPLPLKDQVNLNQVIQRIELGRFDANDVENLLIKLRDYARQKAVFREVADFVAHSRARDRGLAQKTLTAFSDSIQYLQDYVLSDRFLDLDAPFPSYIHRLFISQALLSDESRLKAEYKMSHNTLISKIKANFKVDEKTGTCSLQDNKGGAELLGALKFIMSILYPKKAFHIRDFHKELKDVMRAEKVIFDEAAWDVQADRMSLAILCLISNTAFVLASGDRARCEIRTENHLRLLSGQQRLPDGRKSSEPVSFGRLMILGEVTVQSANKPPLTISFQLIETDLDPHQHCDPHLFIRGQAPEDLGDCEVEIINFSRDMSLSEDFKLVRSDSLIEA